MWVTMSYFLNAVTVTMRYSLNLVTVTMCNLFLKRKSPYKFKIATYVRDF